MAQLSFKATIVFAVILLSSAAAIVSGQDFDAAPSPAPTPALQRGFAVANSVGASAFVICGSLFFAFINHY
ncbi:hypothetical protein TIFTF001_022726 [Ficus carica]|uniref:Transmembrane protein n=1 Tax=Ficus carica TaxID=3494 RepID=A0AA88ATW9_FICCA|nr:hypothetical protein TIFTF001_022726 [Ficus carica]